MSNAVALEDCDLTIIHRADDGPTTHAAAVMALIGKCAEHYVRLKSKGADADPETVLEWIWRDYANHELRGLTIPGTDRVRRYTLDDVKNAMSTQKFRELVEAEQALADAEAVNQRRRHRKEREAQARLEAQIAGERKIVPHLYGLVAELQAEIAALRSERLGRGGARHPLLIE